VIVAVPITVGEPPGVDTVTVYEQAVPALAVAVYDEAAVPVVAPAGTDRVVAVGTAPQPVSAPLAVKATGPPLSALVMFETDTSRGAAVLTGTLSLVSVVVKVTTGGIDVASVIVDAELVAAVSASVAVMSAVGEIAVGVVPLGAV
jgi:hypothetical protein